MANPLKLITVNIEADLHLDLVLPYLEQEKADVVCLQEVFRQDLPLFEQATGGTAHFFPMVKLNKLYNNRYPGRGEWGVALLSHLEHGPVKTQYYKGSADQLPEDPTHPTDDNRGLIWSEFFKDSIAYRVATTHFTWSANAETTKEQRRDFQNLAKILDTHPDWVLCGDFNAPRGTESFSWFDARLTDNVPADVQTTLDHQLHKAGALNLVVDNVFTTPQYRVLDQLQVVSGVSDHCALLAQIVRNS